MLDAHEFDFQGLQEAFYKAWHSGDLDSCGKVVEQEVPLSTWANPAQAGSLETMMLLLSLKRPLGADEKAFYKSFNFTN